LIFVNAFILSPEFTGDMNGSRLVIGRGVSRGELCHLDSVWSHSWTINPNLLAYRPLDLRAPAGSGLVWL
jgi:hypothetical protein